MISYPDVIFFLEVINFLTLGGNLIVENFNYFVAAEYQIALCPVICIVAIVAEKRDMITQDSIDVRAPENVARSFIFV